ncbi:LuxR family transcriptional regulator [Geodermatophilus sp. URMC 63]
MLVVDLDGEPLRALEEILLRLGTWGDDDQRDPSTDPEPLRLPAALTDRVALATVQRLSPPCRPPSPGDRARSAARPGRPLRARADETALTLPAADIDLLSATAAALGHPRLNADIAELVAAQAEQLASGYRRADRSELVSLPARLAGLLDLAATDDTRLLTARLRATSPGTDCLLNDAEEAAHARTADRMKHIWAHGSGIDRYPY